MFCLAVIPKKEVELNNIVLGVEWSGAGRQEVGATHTSCSVVRSQLDPKKLCAVGEGGRRNMRFSGFGSRRSLTMILRVRVLLHFSVTASVKNRVH